MSSPEATRAPAPAIPLRPEFLQRVRALIVDDLPDNRRALELCCDRFGLACESVADGLAAVEAARTGRFDVILMDTFMPRMDGLSATRAIRAFDAAVPVIAMAPSATPGEIVFYRSRGMTDVVPRPLDPPRLLAALSAALAATGRDRWPTLRTA